MIRPEINDFLKDLQRFKSLKATCHRLGTQHLLIKLRTSRLTARNLSMGCSASLEGRRISDSSSVYGSKTIALSERQKKLIQSTWFMLEPKKNELGLQIFLSLFEANPSLQQVFPEFRNVTLDTLRTERALHGHTKRVMKVVGNAVTALEDPDSMTEYLRELGRRHRYRQIKPKPIHLEEICKCIKATFMVFLGSEWTTDVADSWNVFLDSVINLIKEGLRS